MLYRLRNNSILPIDTTFQDIEIIIIFKEKLHDRRKKKHEYIETFPSDTKYYDKSQFYIANVYGKLFLYDYIILYDRNFIIYAPIYYCNIFISNNKIFLFENELLILFIPKFENLSANQQVSKADLIFIPLINIINKYNFNISDFLVDNLLSKINKILILCKKRLTKL